jgi:hypothetical protein
MAPLFKPYKPLGLLGFRGNRLSKHTFHARVRTLWIRDRGSAGGDILQRQQLSIAPVEKTVNRM